MIKQRENGLKLWGPYSKKYMGISRVMEESSIKGARFDLVVHPTYANSAVPAPNVCIPSCYHPWDADKDGNYYQYRYELIWKDALYADVSFFEMSPETWGVRVSYVNQTDRMQNCLLNFFSAVEYPQKQYCCLERPQKSDAWNALDYEDFSFARKRPWNCLPPDGLKKGEVKVPEFTDGVGLGDTFYSLMASHLKFQMFGGEKNDRVIYRKTLNHQYRDAVLLIRYKTVFTDADVVFESAYGDAAFLQTKTPKMISLPLGKLDAGVFELALTAKGTQKNGVILDFFCITEKEDAQAVCASTKTYQVVPQIDREQEQTVYQYAYGEKPIYLSVFYDRIRERELHSGCIEDALPTRLSNSDVTYDCLTMSFSGSFSEKHSDLGYYHNQVAEAIFVPPKQTREVYASVGTQNESFSQEELKARWMECSKACELQKHNQNSVGEPYELSVRILKSVLMSNVVYPIERYGKPIIHYTPGKRWDSLYTWDSGMIGIGMAEYSPEKAEYMLDVYLAQKDEEPAFLFHGSMVPTQFYLWQVLYQRADAKKKQKLLSYYPKLKRYYDFFAGKTEDSTTGRYKSGLLTVYDYFYNASGMDDYPPQKAMHEQHLEHQIAPVCSSVHLICIAKLMREMAGLCGCTQDIGQYDADITRVTNALLESAWDEASGYFGYVVHDEMGQPKDILRTQEGENYNKGMDGVTPLIAGIGTAAQQEKMMAHLKSERELWSHVGISNVDMSASYYYDNGYWNGSVWFPYQYLMWRAMLNLGEGDFAFAIAKRALDAWKKETDFSYHTFELIQIQTERGGWYHQFGGLSAPICSFYYAYFKKKTITTGFDVWIDSSEFDEDAVSAKITYHFGKSQMPQKRILLVVMDENYNYEVSVNGISSLYQMHVKGTLEIPIDVKQGVISIEKNK